MKRNSSSTSLIILLFGIGLILKTSFEIYENRPGKFSEKEINSIVMPATLPDFAFNNVYSMMNDGDVEIVKAHLRKIK